MDQEGDMHSCNQNKLSNWTVKEMLFNIKNSARHADQSDFTIEVKAGIIDFLKVTQGNHYIFWNHNSYSQPVFAGRHTTTAW